MINSIIQALLIVLLILQIIVLLHLLYTNYTRHQEDKKFWAEIQERERQIYEDLQTTMNCVAEAKEESEGERGEDKNL